MKLNEREQFVLLEALDSWEAAPIKDNMSSSMIGLMLGAIAGEKSKTIEDKVDNHLKKRQIEAETLQMERKKEAILLKAKILSENDE